MHNFTETLFSILQMLGYSLLFFLIVGTLTWIFIFTRKPKKPKSIYSFFILPAVDSSNQSNEKQWLVITDQFTGTKSVSNELPLVLSEISDIEVVKRKFWVVFNAPEGWHGYDPVKRKTYLFKDADNYLAALMQTRHKILADGKNL